MESARCWNCNAIVLAGMICDECKTASNWVEKYFENGESCFGCRFFYSEQDVNFSECQAVDPYDCPEIPDEL